jgi:multicomponent Na+:H+ antiporter subunit C
VIAIAATALGVRLARRYFELTGQTELPEDRDAARDD